MDLFHDKLMFAVWFPPPPPACSKPVCQIAVCVKGEGVLGKTMKLSAYSGTLEKAQGFAYPTLLHPATPRSSTTLICEIIPQRG